MKARMTPGFSAEASLYRSGGHCQSGQLLASLRTQRKEMIEPALPVDWFCDYSVGSSGICCLVGSDPNTGKGWHICFQPNY